jgi:hypothetical protein
MRKPNTTLNCKNSVELRDLNLDPLDARRFLPSADVAHHI